MYIQEVIIDGFKSYATRTVVSGFDPQFNAITGLNGSGKSNILDSICFVLGISNLSQVRVGNLQELVYKQGQAGVTKATVTIVFNNADPATSPVGYESHKQITVTRQVVIGGKNKYMINGHTVQQSAVQNLFHSVQLNVNNPHFLIMQGRITKVLNMKPLETLSMIEEAAGTRMFETKKQAAVKTIEKKQLKVEEITKCMAEEITPTLENLREERQGYLTWQSNNLELERLERFCVASEYCSAEEKVSSAEADKVALTSQIDSLKAVQDRAQEETAELQRQAVDLSERRDAEAGGEFAKLKTREADLSKEVVKDFAKLGNHNTTLAAEKETLLVLGKQGESAVGVLAGKEKELQKCSAEVEAKEIQSNAAEAAATSARDKYQNACAGVADADSAALLSLPEQVGAWEKRAREAESQLESGKLRTKHAATALKELSKNCAKQQAAHAAGSKEVEALRTKVAGMEEQLKGVSRGSEDVGARVGDLRRTSSALQDRAAALHALVHARVHVEFKDPEKGFDKSRVKGVLARLLTVRDPKYATALEMVAGGKLFNVVVDTAETANLIIEKGQVKKRITCLPLDKLASEPLRAQRLAAAKAVAAKLGGTCHLALELVDYEPSLERAMIFAFGGTLVCSSAEVGKAVAFHPEVKTKTVTVEGDVYDPNGGTLTGGSNGGMGTLLASITDLRACEAELDAQRRELRSAEAALKSAAADAAAADKLSSELETRRYALQVAEQKLADSSYAQAVAEMAALEAQVAACSAEAAGHEQTMSKCKEELKRLKSAELDMKKSREGAMKEVEAAMKAAIKAASAVKAELTTLRNRRDALEAECAALRRDASSGKEQLSICQSAIARLSLEAETLSAQHDATKRAYEAAAQAVADKQERLNESAKEIKELQKRAEQAQTMKQNASLESRALQFKLKTWEKDFKEAGKVVKVLLQQHPWIEKEKGFFGLAGSDFDFKSKDVPGSLKRLKEIKAEQDRITKKINKKVMGMIEKAESEYAELSRKKEVILNDKAKIEAVIEELDVKKAQALETTWVKVNRDFGSIFSMLLPGTHAKLEPQEGAGVAEGLEVKVSFNGVWKESLTELSGGQRSLLALSLILALLLFKPAPMYILDEVDAALDLSHTQNIGLMLRTHFSSSQFIVVSLKEGMFNNANVIFRTKFVDGVSAVSRTVGRARIGGDAPVAPDENETDGAPSRKKGKNLSSRVVGQGGAAVEA